MASEDWNKAKLIFADAMKIAPAKRSAFLDEACRGNAETRREVESLLASLDDAGSFMEQPATHEVADFIRQNKSLEAGKSFGHYEIVRQIGAGGMGEVFLAKDNKLERLVAVKILNELFAAHESNLNRFIREAKAASALNHPNILVIHEIGASENVNYIVSEFIEGKTLREHFKESAIKPTEVLDIAIQIAGALVAAHAAHIVHRDIKPENIMIRPDGFVKILDFGLAKLVEQKAAGLEASTVRQNQTAKGVILGTVNYMSPEQAKGEKVDARTDIFSFGAVLYEMIAGRTPFAGDSMSETLANLINGEPPPLSRYAANLPDELQRIVAKTLRKKCDERYQTMQGLLADLKDLRENIAFVAKFERSHSSGDKNATSFLRATTGDANNRTDEAKLNVTGQIKRHKSLAALVLTALLVGAIGLGYYFLAAKKTALSADGKKSLAVLPLVNSTQDPNAEYLSDGIADSVINNLSQLAGLRVISRNSAFRFKDNQGDAKNIASQLGVENLVMGDIKQIGDQFIINIRLINAKDDSQIWGNQYVKNLADIIVVQNEISRDVSRKLGARLSGADERTLAKKYTENSEAYQLFLRGRYHYEKHTSQDGQKALDYFERAIALDPNFVLPYSYLTGIYTGGDSSGKLSRRESMLKAKEFALKAVSLDDQLSSAHEALGYILYQYDYDFVGAESEFKRALELDPNDASARESYGGFLSNLGRHEEAEVEMRHAIETNPLSPSLNASYGEALFFARRYDEAIVQFNKALELDANSTQAHYGLAIAYHAKGSYAESIEERAKIAEISGNPQGAAFIRDSFAKGGWQGFLRAVTADSQVSKIPPRFLVGYYAELGEKDKAFAILNRFYEERSTSILRLKVDPRFDSLRDDPRFQELLRRVGMPQ